MVTGMFDLKPIAINPTKDVLEDLTNGEIVLKNEPEYVGVNRDGIPQIKIVVYLQGELGEETFYTNIKFTIDEVASVSKSGKTQFINSAGDSSYANSEDDLPEWFKSNRKVRTAFVGEPQLYKFLMALSGWNRKDENLELCLDTPMKDIIGNDLTELREVVLTLFKDRKIRTVLGVRDGRYQDVFMREFLSEGQTPRAGSRFINELRGVRKDRTTGKEVPTGYGYQHDYQNDLEPKKYELSLAEVLPAAPSEEVVSTEVVTSAAGVPVEEDDMPF